VPQRRTAPSFSFNKSLSSYIETEGVPVNTAAVHVSVIKKVCKKCIVSIGKQVRDAKSPTAADKRVTSCTNIPNSLRTTLAHNTSDSLQSSRETYRGAMRAGRHGCVRRVVHTTDCCRTRQQVDDVISRGHLFVDNNDEHTVVCDSLSVWTRRQLLHGLSSSSENYFWHRSISDCSLKPISQCWRFHPQWIRCFQPE